MNEKARDIINKLSEIKDNETSVEYFLLNLLSALAAYFLFHALFAHLMLSTSWIQQLLKRICVFLLVGRIYSCRYNLINRTFAEKEYNGRYRSHHYRYSKVSCDRNIHHDVHQKAQLSVKPLRTHKKPYCQQDIQHKEQNYSAFLQRRANP